MLSIKECVRTEFRATLPLVDQRDPNLAWILRGVKKGHRDLTSGQPDMDCITQANCLGVTVIVRGYGEVNILPSKSCANTSNCQFVNGVREKKREKR